MRISRCPPRSCPTESNSGGRPYSKGLVALYQGIDVPVLGDAGASEAGVTLGHGPRGTLRHLHSELNRLTFRAHHRPRYYETSAVISHNGEGVNSGGRNGCKGHRGDTYAHEGEGHHSRHEALQGWAGGVSPHGSYSCLFMVQMSTVRRLTMPATLKPAAVCHERTAGRRVLACDCSGLKSTLPPRPLLLPGAV